VEVMKHVSIFL